MKVGVVALGSLKCGFQDSNPQPRRKNHHPKMLRFEVLQYSSKYLIVNGISRLKALRLY